MLAGDENGLKREGSKKSRLLQQVIQEKINL
jgi:hypothetical protein